MTTARPAKEQNQQDNSCAGQEYPLTMAQRLAKRERVFLEDSPSNLSERETRKRIAYASAIERHQSR